MTDAKTSQQMPQNSVDEQTPLLAEAATQPLPHPNPVLAGSPIQTIEDDDCPLPKIQLLLLCYARIVEPMVFFGIFPFVNQMVQDNGELQESDIGFYSGLIESMFSVVQMSVMIFWGRMADRVGRKPVLTISLFGISITAAWFGFCKTIWQMMLCRCLAGAFAGSVVTVRTMTAELCTKRTQAQVFSYFAFAGNIAIFLGPLIGGALADPARQYGGIFARVSFFESYPYALSTLATGGIVCSAAVTTLLFVKETKRTYVTPTGLQDDQSQAKPKSIRDILYYPGVGIVLYLYGYSMLFGIAFTAVTPLFWFTSPALGGTGFSPFMISVYLALTGVAQGMWLLLAFPPLHRRFGTGGVLKICGTACPFVYLQMPLLNSLLRLHQHTATVTFWVLSPILTALGVGVTMVVTAMQLAINDISPGSEALGTLNALALTLASAVRAFSPWMFTTIFAIGARTQVLGGYLIWVFLIVVGIAYAFSVRLLPAKAAGNVALHR